jgi:RimJ/RimL family protein N-acetyltransferase
MIHKLDRGQVAAARSLFRPLIEYQPACAAVLDGTYLGTVFADDPDQPQTAFLTTFLSAGTMWGFLVGNSNDTFNRALNEAIFGRRIIDGGVSSLLLTCHPEDWYGQLPVVCNPRQPAPMPRRHYVSRALDYDWEATLAEGFSIHPMDGSLLDRPNVHLPGDVREVLDRWRSVPVERLRDFGFVVVHEGPASGPASGKHGAEVVSWATVDFVSGDTGDIGFFTEERYRRRGLATAVAAAALEYGLAHGLSRISWTCSEDNLGSIRIAERLGCERERDYVMHVLSLDQAQNLAEMAYASLMQGRYRQAVDLLEQYRALRGDPPAWYDHDLARAWAGLGNREEAFECMTRAVERGWTSIEETEGCSEFESLHGSPQWQALLARLRRNRPA